MMLNDIPTYTNIVIRILTEIDLLLQNFVFNGYNAVSNYLRWPLSIVTAIYLTLFGYGLVAGWVQLRLPEILGRVVRIGLVYMAVLNWGWVSENIVGLVNGLINGLGDALIQASPVQIPGVLGINGAMQLVLIQFTKLGSVIFDTGGLTNLGAWLDGVVIWGFGYLIVGLGLFEIVLSKIMLAILFIFTPLIVLFCYFKPLHFIFDRWLGAIVGFTLLQLFVITALTLGLSIAYWWIAAYVATSALNIGNFGTLPAVIIGIVCIGLIWKAAELAQNLGGTVTSTSGSAMVAGMVGGMVGSGINTATRVVSTALSIPKSIFSSAASSSSRRSSAPPSQDLHSMDSIRSRTKK